MQRAYLRFEVANPVLLLLYHDPEVGNLFMHGPNLSRILLILLPQLTQQIRRLFL
jgi:hypothetical protein